MSKEYFCDNPKCDTHILVPPHVDTITLPLGACHNEVRKRETCVFTDCNEDTHIEHFCDKCVVVVEIINEIY